QDLRRNQNLGRNQGPESEPNRNANLGRNQSPGSDMRSVQHPADNIPNRGASPTSNIRMPESRPMASRNVPRPPSAGGFSGERGMNQGTNGPRSNVAMPSARPETQGRPSAPETRSNVPRPPSGVERAPSPAYSRGGGPS